MSVIPYFEITFYGLIIKCSSEIFRSSLIEMNFAIQNHFLQRVNIIEENQNA